jgi:hypothetical protein
MGVCLPEAMLAEFPEEEDHLRTTMKPIADGLFNACGFPKHDGYDSEGRWERPIDVRVVNVTPYRGSSRIGGSNPPEAGCVSSTKINK